jgi:DNA-directed RNA polymerase specialized sigma24 family protein
MSDTAAIPNTPEGDFERLLRHLDADRDRAGEKYEEIRRRLIKFFECNRSCRAEELTDRTLATVEKKLQAEEIDNIPAYAVAVARNVHRDDFKKSRRVTSVEDIRGGQDSLVDSGGEEGEMVEGIDTLATLACLQECRAKLPPAESMLAIEYYSAEGEKQKDHRQRLAKRLGITMNALRVRANRVRERLEKCVTQCVEDRRRAFVEGHSGGQSDFS